MIGKIVKSILAHLSWKTEEKLILLLSDDWGSVRNRSKVSRDRLQALGLSMDSNRFDYYDTLESNEDLEALFEVLLKYHDCRDNHPVITAVTNTGNPNFENIRKANFEHYSWEPIDETFKRYPGRDKVLDYYRKGMEMRLFVPESHGKEHVHIAWWMEELQSAHSWARNAFSWEYFFIGKAYLENQSHIGLGAAFAFDKKEELVQHQHTLEESLTSFRQLFGYSPNLFTPSALIFPISLESTLAQNNFNFLDVASFQRAPQPGGKSRYRLNYLGKSSKGRMKYLVRNAVFESNLSTYDNGVHDCLKSIETAFMNNHPAIISNHRASFVGGIDEANRTKGVKALDELLGTVIKKWPDVRFVTVEELVKLMTI